MPSAFAKKRVAVLISGRGSNLQSLINAGKGADYPAEIVLVLSNKPDAGGLMRAQQAGIATYTLSHRDYTNRAAFESAMDDLLRKQRIDIVCLAGFMRILGADFIRRWEGRMLNIHPSLLPKHKGLDTHRRALEAGDREAGCTVHFVVPEMDSGPIVLQSRIPIESGDTPDSLAARVLAEEHRIYPEALRMLASGELADPAKDLVL